MTKSHTHAHQLTGVCHLGPAQEKWPVTGDHAQILTGIESNVATSLQTSSTFGV